MGIKDAAIFRDMTGALFRSCFIASFGAFAFGYDQGYWGALLAAPHFNSQFGSFVNPQTGVTTLSTTETSSGTGLGYAGIILGAIIAPWINEPRGRKFSFMTMALVSIVGTVIQLAATVKNSYWQVVAGKIIVNTAIGIAASVIGIYLAECSPASSRGALTSLYTQSQNFGTLAASGVINGVIHRLDSLNWMVPFGVQLIMPVIILAFTPFIPESPRWLVQHGRSEEAKVVLQQLRKPGSDIDGEVAEIDAAVKAQLAVQKGSRIADCFRGTNLRRTWIAMSVQALQQGMGIAFVQNYLILTLIGLGITNAYIMFLYVIILSIVASILGFFAPDYLGRRVVLLVGAFGMGAGMFILAMVSTLVENPTGNTGRLVVASAFIYCFFLAGCWSIIPWTLSSEIGSATQRENTLSLSVFASFGVGLLVSFVSPYVQNPGYGNLGGQIAWIWVAMSIVSVIFVYMFVPDLTGRTLEEVDMLFEHKIPARRFATADIAALAARSKQAEFREDIHPDTKSEEIEKA